jgi:hypothetical protein
VNRVSLSVGVLVVGLLFACVSSASANTVVFGPLGTWSDSNTCVAPCLAVQLNRKFSDDELDPVRSPVTGVVTEWAIPSTDNVTYAFRILRHVPYSYPNEFTGVATAFGMDPGSGDQILRFPTYLPIQRGDSIGIGAVAGDSDVGVPFVHTNIAPSNEWAYNPLGEPGDGANAVFTTSATEGVLVLQATVRFCSVPDVRHLKRVAAKRALAAADCGVRVKKKETNKRKFRGKVLKQKKPAGTTGAPGLAVPIVIGRK